MCGIVGAMAFNNFASAKEEEVRQKSIQFITTDVLQQTVERGKDASGVSLTFDDGNYVGLKMGIPATDFIARFGETEKDFKGLMKIWREYPKTMRTYLGHCRKSSIGNSYDNKNNHPVRVGDTLIIHNGTLNNHDEIFEHLGCGRDGEVDSEAIARLIHYYTDNGKIPFTTDLLKEITLRLDGTFSVLASCANNPFQVGQFRDRRPAEMVLVRPLKTVFVASDKKFLENTLFEYTKMAHLMPDAGFVPLEKDDLDWKLLIDEYVAVWDLTLDVNKDTAIKDLMSDAKSDPIAQKKWKGTTTTYSYGTGYTANNHTNNAYKNTNRTTGTEVNASGKSSTSTKVNDDETLGLAWCKDLNKFKRQGGMDKTKKYGNVEIDASTGSLKRLDGSGNVIPSESKDTSTSGLKETTEKRVEALVSDPAKIKQVKDATADIRRDDKKTSGSGSKDLAKSTGSGATSSSGHMTVKEVDMSSDAEALRAAEDFIDRGLVRYTEDDEVLNDLEMEHSDVLKNLPLFTLANRIRKYMAKRYFFAGYLTRKLEEKENTKTEATTPADQSRQIQQQKHLRLLKITSTILAKALDEMDSSISEPCLSNAIAQIVKNDAIKSENIDKIFSVGDLKNYPMIAKLKKELNNSKQE